MSCLALSFTLYVLQIHLIEAYEDDVCVDLVMELAAGGSLWSRIKMGSYTEATAAK